MTSVAVVAKDDESEQGKIEKSRSFGAGAGLSVALGPALGVAIGIATHNVAVWLAIGIVLGITFEALREGRAHEKK